MHGGQPRAGVVHLPVHAENATARSAASAWWNGTPLRAGSTTRRPRAIRSSRCTRRPTGAITSTGIGKLRSLGSAAYHTVLVARGVARAALLGRVRVWDLAGAGAVLSAVRWTARAPRRQARWRSRDLLDGQRAAGDVVAGSPAALAELRSSRLDRAERAWLASLGGLC